MTMYELLANFDPRVECTLKYSVKVASPTEEISYDNIDLENPTPDAPANLMVSSIDGDKHMPMLDIDIPMRVIPSSTPDHWHLIFPTVRPLWWQYRALLYGLKVCGIIEEGFYNVSIKRRLTSLRLPWVKK